METRRRNHKPKIIVILGPTASGKSDLAVKIAKKINGEIISADSRQVYRGMNIGSGKITEEEKKEIPHHLLNVVSPKRKFSVSQYQKLAQKKIKNVSKKKKIPILCGGSAFYIQSIIDGIIIPEVKPDWKLRKKLEKKSVKELYLILKKKDPRRAKNIEKENPRRLIRAIEIIEKTKNPVPHFKTSSNYNTLIIGIKKDEKELKKLIKKRLLKRFKIGMIDEVLQLKNSGISWKRLESFGLEYKWIAKYLQKKISNKEMKEFLLRDIIKFTKKQMAWWKNDKRIKWIKNYKETKILINDFLK